MDPTQLQRGLKLILKVGSNSTPEYGSGDSPAHSMSLATYGGSSGGAAGPPTAAEAMMSTAPSSDMLDDEHFDASIAVGEHRGERHKKSKKKKKKKDREKKHKHHKEKRHRSERHDGHHHHRQREADEVLPTASVEQQLLPGNSSEPMVIASTSSSNFARSPKATLPPVTAALDGDSSQDGFSFIDENSQPLPENILLYAGITTDNSPSCRPVSKPIVPLKTDDLLLAASPASSSAQSNSLGGGTAVSPTKPLPDVSIMVNLSIW